MRKGKRGQKKPAGGVSISAQALAILSRFGPAIGGTNKGMIGGTRVPSQKIRRGPKRGDDMRAASDRRRRKRATYRAEYARRSAEGYHPLLKGTKYEHTS